MSSYKVCFKSHLDHMTGDNAAIRVSESLHSILRYCILYYDFWVCKGLDSKWHLLSIQCKLFPVSVSREIEKSCGHIN